MDVGHLRLISADSHINEPHDLWYARLPADLRDRAPRRIRQDTNGAWELVIDGRPLGWAELSAEDAARQEATREAEASLDVRLDMMRIDGIAAEIIYPTIGLYVWNLEDPTLGRACCREYNDWLYEHLGNASDRVKLAGMVPDWSVADAIDEVQRNAARGFAGHLLPIVGTPEWNHKSWEPLWDAIDETGLPVAMHQGTGHDMLWYRGPGSATANLFATQSMAPRAVTLLAASGVLERHPSLHFVFVEVNAGWLAWTMSTTDEYYRAHAHWSKPKLAELPSFYMRRQVHATFQNDPVAISNRSFTGLDALMWGNDYPHPESTYPRSREVLAELLRDVTPAEAVAITSGSVTAVFGFEPEPYDSRAPA
jgi:predicted TIM-barrel fold metal-dependent hydrolase